MEQQNVDDLLVIDYDEHLNIKSIINKEEIDRMNQWITDFRKNNGFNIRVRNN
jgi:hypothetical protein